jgi:hypothetical protein
MVGPDYLFHLQWASCSAPFFGGCHAAKPQLTLTEKELRD